MKKDEWVYRGWFYNQERGNEGILQTRKYRYQVLREGRDTYVLDLCCLCLTVVIDKLVIERERKTTEGENER